jgi:hypothetical protein
LSDEKPRYYDTTKPLDGLYPVLIEGKLQLVNPTTGQGVTMGVRRLIDEKGTVLCRVVEPVRPVRYRPVPKEKKET